MSSGFFGLRQQCQKHHSHSGNTLHLSKTNDTYLFDIFVLKAKKKILMKYHQDHYF